MKKTLLMVCLLLFLSLSFGCGVGVKEEKLDIFSGKSENWKVVLQGPHNQTKDGANKDRKITATYIGKEPIEDRRDLISITISVGKSRSATKIEDWLQNGIIENYSGTAMPFIFDDGHIEEVKAVVEWMENKEEILLEYNQGE